MKKILIIALLLASGSAYAQQAGCINATPCVQTNTFIPSASASLSVTSTSARVAVPDTTQQTIVVTNTGASTAYIAIGGSSIVATTSSIPLAVGQTVAFATGGNSYVAGITSAGSSAISLQSGSGVPVVTYGNATISGGTIAATPPIVSPVASSAAEASHVFKASAGTLYGFVGTSGASAGYFLLFDATSAPSNGAVVPKYCMPVTANQSVSMSSTPIGLAFANGVVGVFSTTGCFTQTTSATAAMSAAVQ